MRTTTSPTVVIGNINNRGQQKYQKKTYSLIKHKLQYKTPRSCHQMHISPVVNLKIASGAPPQTGSPETTFPLAFTLLHHPPSPRPFTNHSSLLPLSLSLCTNPNFFLQRMADFRERSQ